MDKQVIEILQRSLAERRKFLLEPEAKEILKVFSISVPPSGVVKDVKEAMELSETIGFPVVIKLISHDVIHKTDVGGVKLDVNSVSEVKVVCEEILTEISSHMPRAEVQGFLIEKNVPKGVEVIIGTVNNPQFGQIIMLGIGGIFVELYRDVSYRLVPITEVDALQMVQELKGFPLFKGFRNQPPLDIEAVVEVLLKIGGDKGMIMEYGKYFQAVDLNPIILYPKGFFAVDARFELSISDSKEDL